MTNILRTLDIPIPAVKFEHPENQSYITYILTTAQQLDFDYPSEYFDIVQSLWNDAGVQECFQRLNESQLIDYDIYFLDRIHEIKKPDYIPSDEDIIHCRTPISNLYD